MKAITKAEVQEAAKKREFPEFVIKAFNDCIVESKQNGTTTVLQDDVMQKIVHASGWSREYIYEQRWLDVEDFYREAGWTVVYDKPAYNEDYKAHFIFK